MSRTLWPFAENDPEARQARLPAPSMLSPGTPRSTPGIVRVSWTKLRPLRGSVSIVLPSTVTLRSEDEVCTSVDTASIVTASVMSPISSATSVRIFWSTPTWTFESDTLLKPDISQATV